MTAPWAGPAGVLVASGIAALGLVLLVLRRPGPAGRWLAVVLAGLAVWSLAGAAEVATADLDARLAWGDVKYVGIGLLPPAWLAFVLHYTGRGRFVTRGRLALLAAVPATVLVLLAGGSTGALVRYFGPEAGAEEFPFVEAGPLFWPFLVYSDTILLAGSGLLVAALARTSRVYWRQSVVLVLATVLPWLVNLAYNLEVEPFAPVDYTPTAFVVSAGIFVWGVYHQHMLDLVPAARRTVMDTMAEGVLVLDARNRVVDSNRTAHRILGRSGAQVVGRTAAQLMPGLWGLAPGDPVRPAELEVSEGGEHRTYDVDLMPLPGVAGRTPGRLLVLRDVTEHRAQQARLQAALAERTRIADALEQSLMPTTLPEIPGVDLAARYRPAGDGSEMGGDFYDAFPLPEGAWALVLGDVSGKGAEAAALTGLVRYTIRALSMEHDDPVEMLARLDRAVRVHAGGERFCTVAYAVLRPDRDGVRVGLTLGGHQQPLVLRADRGIECVGVPGTLLGALPGSLVDRLELTEQRFLLGAGELMLLYSDGVTDARRGAQVLGEEGLVRLVSRAAAGPAVCAHQVAAAVADGAVDFQAGRPLDDVTVLAARAAPDRRTGRPRPG